MSFESKIFPEAMILRKRIILIYKLKWMRSFCLQIDSPEFFHRKDDRDESETVS